MECFQVSWSLLMGDILSSVGRAFKDSGVLSFSSDGTIAIDTYYIYL